MGALVVRAGPFAGFELADRIDRDLAFSGGLPEHDREWPEYAFDRPAFVAGPRHFGDERGDVVGVDLVDPAPSKIGNEVGSERPAVELACAWFHAGLSCEPFLGIDRERLPGWFDPFAAASAKTKFCPPRLGVVQASVDGFPASLPGRVQIGDFGPVARPCPRARGRYEIPGCPSTAFRRGSFSATTAIGGGAGWGDRSTVALFSRDDQVADRSRGPTGRVRPDGSAIPARCSSCGQGSPSRPSACRRHRD